MNIQKTLSILIFLIMGLLALTGCSSNQNTSSDNPETNDQTDIQQTDNGQPKVATFIFTQEFDTLNPIYTQLWFVSITEQIWNVNAWHFDENNEPFPVLVTEMPSLTNNGLSEDGRVLTIHLRDDITWSDGTPITANDFLFTYQMVMNPANTVSSTYPYDLLESVETPDERTVVATFKDPFAPWVATMWTDLIPAHILRPVFEAEGTLDTAPWNNAPTVGAGPYVFAEWESGSYARFVRNENYYGERPNIDEIFIRFVPDDAGQVAGLRTGDGDLGTFISYSDIPILEEAGVKILTVPSGYNEGWFPYLGENGHPALQDERVRQAIAMGFDRFKLNEDLLLGLTQPANTFWDNTPYAYPDAKPWPYDPEQANALLDEAGWIDSNDDGVRDKDGVELVLTHGATSREIRQDTQAVAQQQLAEIGIKLDIQSFPSDVFFAGYGEGGPCATGELDICESSNSTFFPDPNSSRFLCNEIPSDESPEGNNNQALCDPELDGLFQLQATQTDFEQRRETFHKISKLIRDKVYWLGIWQDPDVWAISGRLENVKISGATPFFNIAEWDIKE